MSTDQQWEEVVNKEVIPEGYMQPGEILNTPSADAPLAMRVHDLAFKGYKQVWDTVTGVKSLQPWWLLWQTFSKTREDGTPVFTDKDPGIAPNYGQDLKCYLHPDSPEAAQLLGMGFKPCRKQHIPHEAARELHLRYSHKSAHVAMERLRTERIREEDRDLQKQVLTALSQAAARGVGVELPQTITPHTPEVTTTAVPDSFTQTGTTSTTGVEFTNTQDPDGFTLYEIPCPDCDKVCRSSTKEKAERSLEQHKPYCPGAKS